MVDRSHSPSSDETAVQAVFPRVLLVAHNDVDAARIEALLGEVPEHEVDLARAENLVEAIAAVLGLVLWFGFGLEPRILIAVLIVFFPVLINVMTAVRNIDPDLVNLARSFKATRMQVFWKIQVPGSMPPMFAVNILFKSSKS